MFKIGDEVRIKNAIPEENIGSNSVGIIVGKHAVIGGNESNTYTVQFYIDGTNLGEDVVVDEEDLEFIGNIGLP